MPNRSKDESREALLDAAVDIFIQNLDTSDSVSAALSSISFVDVTAQAGYKGPGIAYYVWDEPGDRGASRRSFEADVMDRIVQIGVENTGVELDADVDIGPSTQQILDTTDAMARSTWKATSGSRTWRLYEVLMMLRGVESVRDQFAASEIESLDALASMIDLIVPALGRQFLANVSAREIAVASRALLSGLLPASELNPDYANFHSIAVAGRDEPVSLYGLCLSGLLFAMTEPLDPTTK